MCTQLQLHQITFEIEQELCKIFGSKLQRIILYGSYARGDYDNESDIDLMVLADLKNDDMSVYRKKVNRVASKVGLKHDIMVTIVLKDIQFFNAHTTIVPFYRNVVKEGVSVYGN